MAQLIGLCYTTYRKEAYLWDEDRDGGKKNAKGESAEAKQHRRALAASICRQCPLMLTCEYSLANARK